MKCPNCGHEFDLPEIRFRFRLRWLSGRIQDIQGLDIKDALRCAGIGAEALRGLDYCEKLPEEAKA